MNKISQSPAKARGGGWVFSHLSWLAIVDQVTESPNSLPAEAVTWQLTLIPLEVLACGAHGVELLATFRNHSLCHINMFWLAQKLSFMCLCNYVMRNYVDRKSKCFGLTKDKGCLLRPGSLHPMPKEHIYIMQLPTYHIHKLSQTFACTVNGGVANHLTKHHPTRTHYKLYALLSHHAKLFH